MLESTSLTRLLATLTARARERRLTDSAWARQAGVRKETLSRLRHRHTCDLETIQALAKVVGARLGVEPLDAPAGTRAHFPDALDREAEARLLDLAASGRTAAGEWEAQGPRFFMAGLAVMLAGEAGQDRRRLLDLAETLHPGATEPAVFTRWLERSPLRPSRFLPMLDMARRHAA